jgi:hypothetical protein
MIKNNTMLLDKDFDKAIIGHFSRCGKPTVVAYDVEKVIRVYMKRDKMTREEAEEFFSFNAEGAWCGEGTPAFIYRAKREQIEELINSP